MQNHLGAVDLGYLLPDGKPLFKSLTFSFGPVRTGLIGPNGVGKTTLLDILAGKRAPSAGSVTRQGRVSYLPQTISFDKSATVASVLGYSRKLESLARILKGEGNTADFEAVDACWDLPERIAASFERLGVAHIKLEEGVGSLSGGELMRIRIAGLLLDEPDFLLLDEPTNHLDFEAREFIYELVASWRDGLVVVTHDRRVLSLVDQTAEMFSDRLKLYGGNFEFYREQRGIERAAAEQAVSGARQRLKHAKATAQLARERQERRAAAGKRNIAKVNIAPIASGLLQRHAENSAARLKARHEKKVEEAMSELHLARSNLPEELRITVDLEEPRVPPGKRMIELRGVNYQYPGARALLWSEPLDMDVIGPERICIKGRNGSGKSTLIDLICGKKSPLTGTVRTGTKSIGVLDQQVSVLDDSLTLLENLRRVARPGPVHELRILLGRFLFYKDDVFKPAATLSGGERMRAGLACLLGAEQAPDILILDEPTNNLDLSSVEQMVAALKEYRGVLIVVSHDRSFVDDIGIEREIEL
ncbi:MAG TPA: ABC-F family ATP-binding cassette domain-containing protein [Blastocatellia bacterium]|nr:ABC-F family ATP-binding cassette domain-containing protein [Blastocatellia bacterium]